MESNQAETRCEAPKHLVTNLEYVLEPHKKKTKFLRAGIDTCTNVNILPISVYKVSYKDPDCVKLLPSSKNGISMDTTEKMQELGYCDLFIVHQDTKCVKKITFQVVNHEGSAIISCATSLELGLIQLHSVINQSVPDCGTLLFSSADHPNKYKNENFNSSSSVSNNASPIEVQSTLVPDVTATEVNQCETQMGQDKNKLMQCPSQANTAIEGRKGQKVNSAHMQSEEPKSCELWSNGPAIQQKMSNKHMPQEGNKNCQSDRRPLKASMYSDKKSQADKQCQITNMQPVKHKKDVQLKKPARKLIRLTKDKNCQATMSHKKQKKCEYKDSKSQLAVKYVCSGKNCQENIMPKKPRSHMQSVTNNTDVWLPKQAIRRLCKDKNWQSTRCYTKYDKTCQSTRCYKSPVRPVYKYDKNCQL